MDKNLKTSNLKDASAYFRPSVATDGVVFNVIDSELYVLLIKRALSETKTTKEKRPYQGYWALPGGFIRAAESAEDAVLRELSEETALKINKNKTKLHQVGFYSTPDRDAWSFEGNKKGEYRQTMSQAFAVVLQKSHNPKADTDAEDAKYFKVSDILNKKIEKKVLAFDHNQILLDAVNLFVKKLALEPVALDFCDEKFTIGDIRAIYESFWRISHNIDSIELGNFQNKMIKQVDEHGNPVIQPMPNKPENKRSQEGRGAPALLYTRNKKAEFFSYVMVPTQQRK
jgi:8-oxo-dGTP diphosphatase